MRATTHLSSAATADEYTHVDREHTMRSHVPELEKYLRDRHVAYVRSEYCGSEGKGEFEAIQFSRTDGSPCLIDDGVLNLRLKDTFRNLLNARYPAWLLGDGSCGDFRWSLSANLLTHVHCLRGAFRERNTHHNL